MLLENPQGTVKIGTRPGKGIGPLTKTKSLGVRKTKRPFYLSNLKTILTRKSGRKEHTFKHRYDVKFPQLMMRPKTFRTWKKY